MYPQQTQYTAPIAAPVQVMTAPPPVAPLPGAPISADLENGQNKDPKLNTPKNIREILGMI